MNDLRELSDGQLDARLCDKSLDSPQRARLLREKERRWRRREFFKKDVVAWLALVVSLCSMLTSYFNWRDNQLLKRAQQGASPVPGASTTDLRPASADVSQILPCPPGQPPFRSWFFTCKSSLCPERRLEVAPTIETVG